MHMGTTQVKETKIDMQQHKIELFKMNKGESIHKMYTRFLVIVDGLGSLGKVIEEKEQVEKILQSLILHFENKVTTTKESSNLSELRVKNINGDIQTYEMKVEACENEEKEEYKKEKDVVFKATFLFSNDDEEEDEEEHYSKERCFKPDKVRFFKCNEKGHM